MENLNGGQDVANKRDITGQIVAKSYFLEQAVSMSRYGSLITINPSGLSICIGGQQKLFFRSDQTILNER